MDAKERLSGGPVLLRLTSSRSWGLIPGWELRFCMPCGRVKNKNERPFHGGRRFKISKREMEIMLRERS